MVAVSDEDMDGSTAGRSSEREPGGTFELRRRKVVERAKETLETASRLIKEKIPCAGHLLAPRRLWLRRVATPNCDVVLVFSPAAKETALMWLLGRLRQSSGLTVHVRHHASTQSTAFYISAPFSVLLKAAEEHHLPKPLRAARGGGLKEFSVQDAQCFEDADNERAFFTTQERQWLLMKSLEGIRAKASDRDALMEAPLGPQPLLEGQLVVPRCVSAGLIAQMFPLHEAPALERLQACWVRDILARQPLGHIASYFGVKIGMYFAWLGHYTAALSVPAVVGTLFWLCCGDGKPQALEDVGFVLFSVFNVVWATVYLQAWKRYSAELAFRWGTLDERTDLLAEPRPLFRGPLETSPVTGRLEPWYPAWKRHAFRYAVSVPLIGACLCSVFGVMIASLQLQDWWDAQLRHRGFPAGLGYVPKVMLAVVISLMDEAYFKIAVWLNDLENHRLETKYENHLIGKVALFQFINSFLSLFYIAFYLQDQARLKEQLAALLIARQVIGNLKESALPYLLEQMRLAKLSFDLWGALSPTGVRSPPGVPEQPRDPDAEQSASPPPPPPDSEANVKRTISQAELESSLYRYDGTFADHLEMMIQLGYVVLFSSAFPPAALCAMLNNLIEIRSDAFKLVYVCQRPFGQRVPNIGTWLNCIEYMGYMAVLVNCALIGLSGQVHRMFPDMTGTQTILLIVALEHIMLCLRFLITCAIPELPQWLATEMAKVEWARREASRLTATATPSPDQQPCDPQHRLIGRFSVSPSHSLAAAAGASVSESRVSECVRDAEREQLVLATATSSTAPTSPAPEPQRSPKPATISAESIQKIPPFKGGPRKSKDWQSASHEAEHHLTIGPSGGVEWARRLKEEGDIHHSAECITQNKDASSSDSDLLRSGTTPMWPPMPRSSAPGTSAGARLHRAHGSASAAGNASPPAAAPGHSKAPPQVEAAAAVVSSGGETSLSDSSRTVSSAEEDAAAAAARAAEELAAKKTRVKQSLMKRARSVAIFSLKLKERRAREAQEKAAAKQSVSPTAVLPPPQMGGEMACIPIEKLIQLEDVRRNLQQHMQQQQQQPPPSNAGTL